MIYRLRFDKADRKRLDAIAAHYAVTAAAAIRILLKEKVDSLEAKKEA